MGVRLVTDNDPAEVESLRRELRRAVAEAAVRASLVELAANILRVMRGAGFPGVVHAQARDALAELRAYYRPGCA